MQHYDLRISGKVQGVYFRYSTQQKAIELGITGFVRNEDDGTVYVECEGEPQKLKKFIDWCHRGPILAKVEEVKKTSGPLKGYVHFEIERGS